MAENDTDIDEPASIPLWDLYKSIQDQLRLTLERCLDMGKQSLAGRLDDILLRQTLWEEDIHLKDGALSHLEASDTFASSTIRLYLDDIRLLLHDINGAISESEK